MFVYARVAVESVLKFDERGAWIAPAHGARVELNELCVACATRFVPGMRCFVFEMFEMCLLGGV